MQLPQFLQRKIPVNESRRLLVVDDEPEIGKIVAEVAKGVGYETRVTTDGHAFKREFADFLPTVVVLDVVMPDIEGIELVDWLATENYRGRLIVITGYNPDYALLATRLGEAHGLESVATLGKPIRVAELREHLV